MRRPTQHRFGDYEHGADGRVRRCRRCGVLFRIKPGTSSYQFMTAGSDEWLNEANRPRCLPAARPKQESRQSFVYFIRCGQGAIKIGRAFDVHARLRELQVGNPERLELLHCLDGGSNLEATLHQLFAKHRLQGEWFSPAPALMALIEDLRGPVLHALPGGG